MQIPRKAVVVLEGQDPAGNLSGEEALWDLFPAEEGSLWLVLYGNSRCVVMGKNQNPLREVRMEELGRRRIPLFRRCTGGGTVWHDEGNLNFSFMVPKVSYQREEVQAFLLKTLGTLGFPLTATDKGDLLLDGLKVSGNAYAFKKDKVLHHGTLLCRADLAALKGVLGTIGGLTEWTGVASRPMGVMNLADRSSLPPEEVLPSVKEALVQTFIQRHGGAVFTTSDLERRDEWKACRDAIRERLVSPQWTFDHTPPFSGIFQSQGKIFKIRVENGVVTASEPADPSEMAPDADAAGLSTRQGSFFFPRSLF